MFIFKPVSSKFLFTKPRIAIVSVINDLATDHRVQKTCFVLKECGYDVVLHGRLLKSSLPIKNWPFRVIRIRLFFTKGPFFYFFYNLRLFFFLLFNKSDLLYANDLDTLPANYLASKFKNTPLVYDSHELFCDVPELLKTPVKRRICQRVESFIVPKLKYCITVNESIAGILSQKFSVPFISVRNIPSRPENLHSKSKSELGLSEFKHILILQGAGINMDRGVEELIQSMRFVDSSVLLVIGSGDNWEGLKDLSRSLQLGNKIRFIPKLPRQELLQYTRLADLGLSLDKNSNPNYYYSLPNKIFDYIHCGVPVLASRLPEIENLINQYRVGTFIDSHHPEHIAGKISQVLGSKELESYKANTLIAKETLSWEQEKQKLKTLINGIR